MLSADSARKIELLERYRKAHGSALRMPETTCCLSNCFVEYFGNMSLWYDDENKSTGMILEHDIVERQAA